MKKKKRNLADIDRFCWKRYEQAKNIKYRKLWLKRCAIIGAKLRNWPKKSY